MKCDNLKAYLDGELGLLGRLSMSRHLKTCQACRENAVEWTSLSCEIEQLEGEPVSPALRNKLAADAMTAAASYQARNLQPLAERQRPKGVFMMKRAFVGAGAILLLIALAFGVLPLREEGHALADMAHAMAKVGTVHFTGFAVDGAGEHRKLEGWVKGANKLRITIDGVADIADDGRRLVAVELGDLPKVTVRSTGGLQGLAKGMTYLDLFSDSGRLRSAIAATGAKIADKKDTTLADGRPGVVTELVGDGGERMRIFTDARTSLLARSETYDRSGELIECIEQVKYDIPVSDSVFKMNVPKDLPVLDMESPEQEMAAANRQAELERLLEDPNAKFLLSMGRLGSGEKGSCATDIHPGIRFEVQGPGLAAVFYLADQNVYRIIGKGQAHSVKDGWRSAMVEDGDIRVPGEPQVEEVLMLNGRPGDYCGKGRSGAYRFLNVGPGPATVTYHRVKDAYVIRGTVKILPTGRVCTNDVTLPTGKMYLNDVVKQLAGFNQELVGHANSGKPMDWGGLPQSEIESMKADLDTALRIAEINSSRDGKGRVVIDGAKATGQWGGHGSSRGIRFEGAGPGTEILALEVPSREELHIIGRAHIQVNGKPDRTVKNAVISFGGEIISSEE